MILKILEDCKLYLGNFYHKAIMVGMVLAFFYCLLLFLKVCGRGVYGAGIRRAFIKAPFVAVLGFYCYLVLGVTVLAREAMAVYMLHPVPFSTWGSEEGFLVLWAENILMTIPLGILLYILWKPFRKPGWLLLAGGLFSMVIECTQLFMRLGKFETDDIMNNMLGSMIGFGVCKSVSRFWIWIKKSVK